MTRDEIFDEMTETFGQVPIAYRLIPEDHLEDFWNSWKHTMQKEDTIIPGKYRMLMGLAISAALGDQYDVAFYTEIAKMQGATEQDIQEIAFMIKGIAGWKQFLQANQVDLQQFKNQLTQIIAYMRDHGGIMSGKKEQQVKSSI